MGRLSTHVLDTASGRPAANLRIDLAREGEPMKTVRTDADGRTEAPLISGPLDPGRYTLTFHAGAYLRAAGHALPEPAFLDEIVIAFGIAEPEGHYHVPLLLSPYGYSTYRGS